MTSLYLFGYKYIKRSNGSFQTPVYQKPTFIRRFQINFESFFYQYISYRALFFTLLFRYFNICSSYIMSHGEMENFKKLQQLIKLFCGLSVYKLRVNVTYVQTNVPFI